MNNPLLGSSPPRKESCGCCTYRRLQFTAVVFSFFGIALLLLSTWLPGAIEDKVNKNIDDYVFLSPESAASNSDGWRAWSNWADPDSLPVYYKVYAFNLTNPEEFYQGAKPNLTEHGPYVFREYKIRYNTSFSVDEDSHEILNYQEWVYYTFQRDMTDPSLSPDDKFTFVNLPLHAVYYGLQLQGAGPLVWDAINSIVSYECPNHQPFGPVVNTPYDFLFQRNVSITQFMFGYQDCLFTALNKLKLFPTAFFPGLSGPNYTDIYSASLANPFNALYTGRFGYESNVRSYHVWAGEQYLTASVPGSPVSRPVWGTTTANRIRGGSGAQFRRHLEKGDNVTVYVDEISRSAVLSNYDGQTVDVHGIELLRFQIQREILQNITTNPANAPYYMYVTGLINETTAKPPLPIFECKAHFLDADPVLVAAVNGISPDRDLHDTLLDVEPLSGVTMQAQKRLQVNILMKPLTFLATDPKNLTRTIEVAWGQNITQTILPMVWVEESGVISSSSADKFKQVYVGLRLAHIGRYVFSIVGSIFIGLFGVVLFFMAAQRKPSPQTVQYE